MIFPYMACILSYNRLAGKLMPGRPGVSGAESEVAARSGRCDLQRTMKLHPHCGKAALSAAALAGRGRLVEAPDRYAAGLGLVGEVGGDAGAGEGDDTDRQRLE